mmetsp:Transcript_1913/g.5264  ORF Transcript_1913/g.5264 Transcript_1913/m.5264 type:complete len:404 (+) Transcript_1913:72-1283(+)|eukprot:CAMPEP_0168722916 /NCGR_PEP_ID=MMETSP0724-20121128/2845_1 /TAXON_ID=265536 /ORGANISM="Amphiprora sp., Strain CCMP467" /LENGTH=403 /DNA_ID=CAMNT_0008769605 /DNA_START=67 /DNA_END=1278 /DNA_ORIENTATION=-
MAIMTRSMRQALVATAARVGAAIPVELEHVSLPNQPRRNFSGKTMLKRSIRAQITTNTCIPATSWFNLQKEVRSFDVAALLHSVEEEGGPVVAAGNFDMAPLVVDHHEEEEEEEAPSVVDEYRMCLGFWSCYSGLVFGAALLDSVGEGVAPVDAADDDHIPLVGDEEEEEVDVTTGLEVLAIDPMVKTVLEATVRKNFRAVLPELVDAAQKSQTARLVKQASLLEIEQRHAKMFTASKRELKALEQYTRKLYVKINRALRGFEDPSKGTQRLIDELKSCLRKFQSAGKTSSATTYRGCLCLPQALVDTWKEGGIFQDSAFFSTSTKRQTATSFAPEFLSSVLFTVRGTSGVSISDFSSHGEEAEVLFSPNTMFRIRQIETVGEATRVELEEIPVVSVPGAAVV